MKQIADKFDEFLEVELRAHPEEVDRFFERVLANYDEAIKTATRFLLLMIAAWFVTYAIHMEWITQIEWLGITFNRQMTIASPFLIGLLSYQMQSALAGAVALWEAISRRLRYTLPTAWKHQLDDFLAPPTFSNVERMLEPEIAREKFSVCSRGWFIIVTITMFVGSIGGVIHAAALLIYPSRAAHLAWITASTAFGLLAWARGAILSTYAIMATGGFNSCHHRGTRTPLPPAQSAPNQETAKDSPSVSPAPTLQPQPSTIQPGVAPGHAYRQARLLDLGRADVVIVVEDKKRLRRIGR